MPSWCRCGLKRIPCTDIKIYLGQANCVNICCSLLVGIEGGRSEPARPPPPPWHLHPLSSSKASRTKRLGTQNRNDSRHETVCCCTFASRRHPPLPPQTSLHPCPHPLHVPADTNALLNPSLPRPQSPVFTPLPRAARQLPCQLFFTTPLPRLYHCPAAVRQQGNHGHARCPQGARPQHRLGAGSGGVQPQRLRRRQAAGKT